MKYAEIKSKKRYLFNGVRVLCRNPSNESRNNIVVRNGNIWYFNSRKYEEVHGTKLQIVDGSEVFCSALKELLPSTFEIDICMDGAAATTRICSFRPDILVLSAMLPCNDGFYVLQTVQNAGVRPMVLVLTPLVSDYVYERVAELKVDYMLPKPCDMHAVVSCIENFRNACLGEISPIQNRVRNLLFSLGFRTNLCGYRYLFSALCILWENPGQSLTKELYPAVAKEHKGSWQQIEHGIRLSIADAWADRTRDGWRIYFPNEKAKPTNSVFLTRMAQCLLENNTKSAE